MRTGKMRSERGGDYRAPPNGSEVKRTPESARGYVLGSGRWIVSAEQPRRTSVIFSGIEAGGAPAAYSPADSA